MTESKSFRDNLVYNTAMVLFSFSILAVETLFMHQLLIITNYLTATFVVAIAMFGIAVGSFLGFYLSRFNTFITMPIAALLYLASMPLSYNNIVKIGYYQYPYFLILPFMFAAIIVSMLFSRANSNKIYFADLVAATLGVIYPIFAVSALKSENALIALMFIPAVFIFIISFVFRNIFSKILMIAVSVVIFTGVFITLKDNLAVPTELGKTEFEQQILPKIKSGFDKQFMTSHYKLQGDKYILKGDEYDEKRAKYVLNDIGHWDNIDINYDIKVSKENPIHPRKQWASLVKYNYKFIFSEDDLMGKIDLFAANDDTIVFCTNALPLDSVDKSNGSLRDPRVPHMNNADIFIIGLSYDGIVKSAKRLPGSNVSGVEFSPIIMKIMMEKNKEGKFSKFGHYPYKGLDAYRAEGRYFLSSNKKFYDMITLMNLHYEYPAIASLAPEYLHTKEATKIFLNKLTDRGMIVYEEILETQRTRYAFYKLLNTLKQALIENGAKDPKKHIIVFSWDFWGPNGNFQTVMVKKTPFTDKELADFQRYYNLIDYTNSKGVKQFGCRLRLHPTKQTGHMFEKVFNANPPVLSMTDYPDSLFQKQFNKTFTEKLDSKDDQKFIESLYRYNSKFKKYYLNTNIIKGDTKERFLSILDKVDYPYEIDLTPTTDDKPFPFNVYKNKAEVKGFLNLVLKLAGLLFIPVILIVFFKYKAQRVKLIENTVFFGLLGFGFMLMEMVLMQKYQRFIGSPIYSTIVILGGLLFFSGLGSFFSRKFSKKKLVICIAIIPVLILFQAFFLTDLFNAFATFSFPAKLVISAILIFPLAFLMGMPFPHALEQIKKDISDEYATLMFGINGALGTLAVTSSLLLNVTYGMNTTMMIGFITYVAALGLFIIIKKK